MDLFRIDANTVGIADPALIHGVLNSRSAIEAERPTFKPICGKAINRQQASKAMQAVGRDVREALKHASPQVVDLLGSWPHAGQRYLRNLVFENDPLRLRILIDRLLIVIPSLTWAAVAIGAVVPLRKL